MIALAFVGVVLTLSALIFMCWLAFTAPYGWEDENGFYRGHPGPNDRPDI